MKLKSSLVLLILCLWQNTVDTLKEFSLARFSDTAVYANNSVINIHLIGEGFEGVQITDGGALECHTDDPTCCRGIDDPPNGVGRGEWFYPNGSAVPAPGNSIIYRTRSSMVIRLNRGDFLQPTGVYRCEVPTAGGDIITRYIEVENSGTNCPDLELNNGLVTYVPPRELSPFLPPGQRYIGTVATYNCLEGYNLANETVMQTVCAQNGTWNETEPFCEAVDCGPLTNPVNGQVDTSSGTTFMNTATYSCDIGFALNEQGETRTCGSDGNWTSSAPTCVVDCGILSNPDNGQVNLSNGTVLGSTASYSCDTGYTLTGSTERICGDDGMWSLSEPVCEAVNCGLLIDPDNGQVNTSSGTTFGSTASYSCDTGFVLIGDADRICGSNGNWGSTAPTCLIDCGLLTDPDNGQVVTSPGTTFGSTASYSCDTGYTLSDSSLRTCGADGMWTLSQPVCNIVNCGSLPNPANGQVNTSSGTTFGSTATYSCDSGYVRNGANTRTCESDGMWSNTQPSCDIVDCNGLSNPTNGQVNTSPGTTFGSTATYSCDTGYSLTGSTERTCEANGVWSGAIPVCTFIDCGPLPNPDNGQVDTSSGTGFGSTANYSCNSGYALSHQQAVTCGGDQVWAPDSPTCILIDCGSLTNPDNGQVVTSSGTTFGSTASYSCDDGYTLTDSTERLCLSNGIWSPGNPVCERVIIQLRFGQLNCVDYTTTNSGEKLQEMMTRLLTNVGQECSCSLDSNPLLSSQFRCFDESTNIVTFRTQLMGSSETTTSEMISALETWLQSDSTFLADGVSLTFNTTCPLVIEDFDSEECPNTFATPTVGPLEGSTVDITLIVSVILGVLLLVSIIINVVICCYCVFWRSRSKDSYNVREQQSIPGDNPYVYNGNGQQRTEDFDMSLMYENTDSDLKAGKAGASNTMGEHQFNGSLEGDPEVYTNVGTATRKEGEAGVYEEIQFTRGAPRPAPTPYERPQTSQSKLDLAQLPPLPLPTEGYYQRPRANTDSRVKDMIVANPHYEVPRDIAAPEGSSTTTTTGSAVPGPGQYDHIRPRTSSTMVANCPVYAPVDIKKV